MHIACWSFGIGALLVGALGKFIPPEHSGKFALNFSESEGAEGNDVVSRITSRFTQPIKKSETERLLDSN